MLLCSMFITPELYSQKDSSDNSLLGGKWALMFSINNNFNISSLEGAMLSGKYQFSTRTAVRAGFGVNYSNSEGIIEEEEIASPIESTTRGYNIHTYFVYYFLKNSPVNPYIASGPFYDYDKANSSQSSFDESAVREESTWSLGMGFLFGVEWFPAKSIGLFAEYNPRFFYSKYNYYRFEQNEFESFTRKINTDGFSFSGNTARLGLGVYF